MQVGIKCSACWCRYSSDNETGAGGFSSEAPEIGDGLSSAATCSVTQVLTVWEAKLFTTGKLTVSQTNSNCRNRLFTRWALLYVYILPVIAGKDIEPFVNGEKGLGPSPSTAYERPVVFNEVLYFPQ